MKKTAIELFAGVGGFRVGLNHVQLIDNRVIENNNFTFVWANQWEPSTKVQQAYECYRVRFGGNTECSNVDISVVNKNDIPEHNLLCGGFPCQDYSVARSLSKEKGIEGKKGVLWWQIREILEVKHTPFVFLENVDRLTKSPASQRGRDFGIMLRTLYDLGYIVEWRIINAAEYGMPQRRRRTYIFAYHQSTKFGKSIKTLAPNQIISEYGAFARAFPITPTNEAKTVDLKNFADLIELSNSFKFRFENSGIMMNGNIYTANTTPYFEQPVPLKEIVQQNVDEHYFLSKEEIKKFEYLRGSKKIPRHAPNGSTYIYSEGAMSPYDDLTLPGRTMLTSEGSVNRSTHIIKDPTTNEYRKLTPIECERLNQFPDNWTNTGMPEKRRYFMMGNALVCGIISRFGLVIEKIIENED